MRETIFFVVLESAKLLKNVPGEFFLQKGKGIFLIKNFRFPKVQAQAAFHASIGHVLSAGVLDLRF